MSGGVEVGDLNVVVQPLGRAAFGLRDLGDRPPPEPGAGASTGRVAQALAALADAMSQLSLTTAQLADAVQANGENYRQAEARNTANLEASGGGR